MATQINSVEGEEVAIEGTYTYDDEKDSDYKEGLVINKNLKINGNNFIIDGKNKAILNFTGSNNFELKNVKILNCIINNKNTGFLTINNNITHSQINNFANLDIQASVYNSIISNNEGITSISAGMYYSSILINNGTVTLTGQTGDLNIINNEATFHFNVGAMRNSNVTNNNGNNILDGYFEGLNLTNSGTIDFLGSYLGSSNVINYGDILIKNYFGENNLTIMEL